MHPESNKLKIVSSRDRLHSGNGQQKQKYNREKINSQDETENHNYLQVDNAQDFNPKIMIRPYFSPKEGLTNGSENPVNQRAQTGKPQKRTRNNLAKSQRNVDKEKIYRLPSLSKCLEHQILPKSSLMLKQICEIASQNTGFIKTHFEEYVKRKAKHLFSGTAPLKVGALSTKNQQPPQFQVDGNQKERVRFVKDIQSYKPKQQIPVGITNFEMTIDPPINMINQPVVLPQATFTNGSKRPMSQQAADSDFYTSKYREGINSSQGAGSVVISGGRITSQHSPKSQMLQYSPSSKLPNGASFDPKMPRNSQPYLGTQAHKEQSPEAAATSSHQFIRSSQQILKFGVPGSTQNLDQIKESQRRKNVYSSKTTTNRPIVKQYNGRSYVQYPSKMEAKKSDNMVQTEAVPTQQDEGMSQSRDKHNDHIVKTDPSQKELLIPHIPSGVLTVNQILQPHLTKSASSSSSIEMLSGHLLQDLLQQQSQSGTPHLQNRDGMTAIQIKQYQFVGGVHQKGGITQKNNQKQFFALKNVNSTSNMLNSDTYSGQGRPNTKTGNMTSRQSLQVQNVLNKEQTPSSLMVQAYNLNQPLPNQIVVNRMRNNFYYSTVPSTGRVSPNKRYYPQPNKQQDQAQSPRFQHQDSGRIRSAEGSNRGKTSEGTSSPRQQLQFQYTPHTGQQPGPPYNFLFKKSEEKEGISANKRSHVFIHRMQPNTNDLAPVYDHEDAQNYYINYQHEVDQFDGENRVSPRQEGITSTGQGPTSYYSMLDQNSDPNNLTHNARMMEEDMRNQSQLFQDRMRMQEHLKNTVIDSFQKNNVRTEMAHMTPEAFWGTDRPQITNNGTPGVIKEQNSRRTTTSPKIMVVNNSESQKPVDQISSFQDKSPSTLKNQRESYIPQIVHLNNQVRLNTSYESQRPRILETPQPQQQNSSQASSPQAQGSKPKENFTIVLPPTTQVNANQISANDISPSFMSQTQNFNQAGYSFGLEGGKITHMQNQPHDIEITRLNRNESEDLVNNLMFNGQLQVNGGNNPIILYSQMNQQQEEHQFNHMSMVNSQGLIQGSPDINTMIMYGAYNQPTQGPIQSVYQVEQEAKAYGLIKEMTFVAPPNHDTQQKMLGMPQPKFKAHKRLSHIKDLAKTTQQSTQGSIIIGEGPETSRILNKGNSPKGNIPSQRHVLLTQDRRQSNQIFKREDEEQVLFSDSDDELAQKLMRQVMPSNYSQIKKRRGDLASVTKSNMAASMDFSGRAAQKLIRNSFGIKKLEPRDFSNKDNLKSSRYQDIGRIGKSAGEDQLKLISFAVGTAPSQYKLDIPEINSKIMSLFSQTDDIESSAIKKHNLEIVQSPNNQTQVKPILQSPDTIQKDMDQIQEELNIRNNKISIAIQEKGHNSTIKTPLTEDQYLYSPRLFSYRSNQDSWAVQTQSRGKMLMINGSHVNMMQLPQQQNKTQKPKKQNRPTSSKLNLIQDVNDLRNQGNKFIQRGIDVQNLDTLGVTNGGGTMDSDALNNNQTQFLQGPNDQLFENNSELKNLCIKTTISITHHNPYSLNPPPPKNLDLINVKAPPTPILPDKSKPQEASGELLNLQQMSKNASSNSQRFMQPLGSQLRSRRNGGGQVSSGATLESGVIEPPMIVTKTTVNYDSRTGLQQVTETTRAVNRFQQQQNVKNMLNQNLLRLNSCEKLMINSGQQTIPYSEYHPVQIPNTQHVQHSVSTVSPGGHKRDDSQLTYNHMLMGDRSQNDITMNQGVMGGAENAQISQCDEKLGARFSSNLVYSSLAGFGNGTCSQLQ